MTSFPLSILLDLDGTLIDSQPGILASCNAAILALGHEPDPSLDLAAVIGPPMDEVMRHILTRYEDDRVTEAVSAYREHYGTIGLFGSTVYPEIPEAMDRLIALGAKLYVATSKRTVFAHRILDHLGLTGRLTGVFGSEAGGALDEKTELIAHMLKHEGITPARCIMVGDRRYDVLGAHANNMHAIGVLWGYGSQGELEAAGADELIRLPTDLPSTAIRMETQGK